MTEDHENPLPPPLSDADVRSLIAYADAMADALRGKTDAETVYGYPSGGSGHLLAGWDFTALALRESYPGRA